VVDSCSERNLGWLEGVVCGEVDGEEEDAALVGRVGGTHDGCLPMEHVLADGTGRALGGRVLAKVLQLLVDPLQCHSVSAQLN